MEETTSTTRRVFLIAVWQALLTLSGPAESEAVMHVPTSRGWAFAWFAIGSFSIGAALNPRPIGAAIGSGLSYGAVVALIPFFSSIFIMWFSAGTDTNTDVETVQHTITAAIYGPLALLGSIMVVATDNPYLFGIVIVAGLALSITVSKKVYGIGLVHAFVTHLFVFGLFVLALYALVTNLGPYL